MDRRRRNQSLALATGIPRAALLFCALAALADAVSARIDITGDLKIWHKITLTFDGPDVKEEPSTFRDYKLTVTFTKGSRSYEVPGFFAADGNAAETSASAGDKWRVHFSPDATGRWQWTAKFVIGKNAAYDEDTVAVPMPAIDGFKIDGSRGSFMVANSNKRGIDNRSPDKGRLEYVRKHHLKWAGSDNYFLKFGADSPENFLAYRGFDDTPDIREKGFSKNYTTHISDYKGDGELWQDRGHGIFGALNYLADQGANVHSFLTGNIGGDDKNVFMYVSNRTKDRDVFDVSKLEQWERVFEHMDKKGMFLHFKTQERENDGGVNKRGQRKEVFLRPSERMIYYRELVARFSHHLALNWNIGEENSNTPQEREDFSNWIFNLDPYKHLIVIHTSPRPEDIRDIYGDLIRNVRTNSYSGSSLQVQSNETHSYTLELVGNTSSTIRPWVVACDETNPADRGIFSDFDIEDPNHDIQRPEVIYGNIMGGGGGVETYTGSNATFGDQRLEDYRLYQKWWNQGKLAVDFFVKNAVPFQDMANEDEIAESNAWVLRNDDFVVVYLFSGSTTTLDLSADGKEKFSVAWYNPSKGGALKEGSIKCIAASRIVSVGDPPKPSNPDWVVLLKREACRPTASGPVVRSPVSTAKESCFAVSDQAAKSREVPYRRSVLIEAELAVDLNGWATGVSEDVTYITWDKRIPSISDSTRTGIVKYNFVVPESGVYYLNVRVSRGRYGVFLSRQSFFVRLNDGDFEIANVQLRGISFGSAWKGEPNLTRDGRLVSPKYRLKSGKNTMEIIASESDVWIDEFYILPIDLTGRRRKPGYFRQLERGTSNIVPC